MPTMTRNRPRSRLLVFAIALPLLATLLAATAMAAPKNKPYATDISPDSVLAGTCVNYTGVLENQTKTQQLGSANYTLDSRFEVGTPDCPFDGTISGGGPLASLNPDSTDPNVLLLRDLELAPDPACIPTTIPGACPGVTFTFHAATQCPPNGSTYDNEVTAKQSNNFSGDTGNDLSQNGSFFDLNVSIVGTCSDDGSVDPQTGPKGSYSVETSGTGRLILAVYGDISCDGYTAHTDTVTVQLLYSTNTKTLTMTFTNVNNEPKNSFRICWDPDEDGPAVAYLLPACDSTDPVNTPPCMLPVEQTKKMITLKALLPANDGRARG
jgi:hypothetical protein